MTLNNKISAVLGDEQIGLDIGDWGSCQYGGAEDIFNALEKVGMKELGVQATWSKVNSTTDAVKDFKEFMQQDYEDAVKLYDRPREWMNQEDKKDLVNWNKLKGTIETISDCIDWCKNEQWDLWSVAPVVSELCFDNLELHSVEKAKGAGPIMNVMAQGENNHTGFYCWLLWSHGFVGKDIAGAHEVFGDFCT